jgi:hypothetical protein
MALQKRTPKAIRREAMHREGAPACRTTAIAEIKRSWESLSAATHVALLPQTRHISATSSTFVMAEEVRTRTALPEDIKRQEAVSVAAHETLTGRTQAGALSSTGADPWSQSGLENESTKAAKGARHQRRALPKFRTLKISGTTEQASTVGTKAVWQQATGSHRHVAEASRHTYIGTIRSERSIA